MEGLLLGRLDPLVLWCLQPALERARRLADHCGLRHIGLVAGVPKARQWAEIDAMRALVVVLGPGWKDNGYHAAAMAQAKVVCAPEPADLGTVNGPARPTLITGLPAPPAHSPPRIEGDYRTHAIRRACALAEPRIDDSQIAVAAGTGSRLVAEAVAGWRELKPVVALSRGPVPSLLLPGRALVANETLLGLEAVELLATAPALRRALARRGARAMEDMPSANVVAEELLEAMALAAAE